MENKKALRLVGVAISTLPPEKQLGIAPQNIEKAALAGDNFRIGSDLVYFYDQVRTDFEENG